MNKIGRGAAKGKVILFGEHAVVYGEPAVAIPIDSETKVEIRKIDSETSNIEPVFIKIIANDIGGGVDHIVGDTIPTAFEEDLLRLDNAIGTTINKQLRHENGVGFEVEINSEIPRGAGLGSSAALSVALIRAIADIKGPLEIWNNATILNLAHEVDQFFNGEKASGVDTTVSALEKPIIFQRTNNIPTFKEIKPGCDFNFVIGVAGTPDSSTATLVSKVKKECETSEGLDQIKKIGDATVCGIRNIERGDPMWVGRYMKQNHAALRQLDVSSENLDALCDCANASAKLTGAGTNEEGGSVIALAETEEIAKQVEESWNNLGIKTLRAFMKKVEDRSNE